MTNDLYARIAGMVVRYTGDLPDLSSANYLPKYLVSERAPDLTVLIEVKEQLTPPKGDLRWETFELRVFETADAFLYYYRFSRPPEGYDYIRLQESKNNCDLLQMQVIQGTKLFGERALLGQIIFERQLHLRNRTMLHASWVMHNNKALLFSGSSGVGKSTQAELWKQFRKTDIINGDKVGLWFQTDGIVAVGTPYCGSSPYFDNTEAQVEAIVLLEQAPENTIRRLGISEAVRRLSAQMPVQKWRSEDVSSVLSYAQTIAQELPVYLLSCTKDERAVVLLEKALEDSHGAITNNKIYP